MIINQFASSILLLEARENVMPQLPDKILSDMKDGKSSAKAEAAKFIEDHFYKMSKIERRA